MLRPLIIVISLSICFAAPVVEECEIDGIKFAVGEEISVPGKCLGVECMTGGTIQGYGCGIKGPDPPASDCVKIPTDYSELFPLCCSRWECKSKTNETEVSDEANT